ncbi:MAG TPA: metal-sensing transcriptional repressor [Thermoplasmata archaeon]|nr:metal-sensing transcriptional repressor [Thermoplasmata archaeon]
MAPAGREDIAVRLKTIEGHFHALHRMVDEDRPYPEIVRQLVAVRSSVDAVMAIIVGSLAEQGTASATRRARRALRELREVVDSVL